MQGKRPAKVRGSSDHIITTDEMMRVGKAIGKEYREISICTDNRASSRALSEAFIAGALFTGATVYNNGAIPVPALPFSKCDPEMCIAIGNPDTEDDVGGFNLMNPEGSFFTDAQMIRFREHLDVVDSYRYKNPGRCEDVTGTSDTYMRKLNSEVNNSDVQVVVDCYSNAIHTLLPPILSNKGAEITVLSHHMVSSKAMTNDKSDLKSLFKAVKANYGSIGVAINRDGTSIKGMDENGEYIDGTKMFAILLKYLKPSSVALPVDTSMMVTDALKTDFTFTPVDPTYIGEFMKTNRIKFGGSSDGSFIFPSVSYCPDGLMATATLCSMATEFSLSNMTQDIPEYHSLESSYRFNDNPVLLSRKIDENIDSMEGERITKMDGWRIDYEEGWFLVRIVGQTVKVEVESRDKVYATGLMEIAAELVDECLRSINR